MSLRDWFAGMVAMGNRARGTVYHSWEDLAKDAYEAADSMLAFMKKPQAQAIYRAKGMDTE